MRISIGVIGNPTKSLYMGAVYSGAKLDRSTKCFENNLHPVHLMGTKLQYPLLRETDD